MVRNETLLITGIHLSAPVSVKGVDHRRSGRIDGGSNSVQNELDVCVTMMLLEDSPAVLPLCLLCTETVYSFEKKNGESPSLNKDVNKKIKSEKHVPIVAVSKELRIPDDDSKASWDRLQIPGAKSSRDWSRKVPQFDVPSQDNPNQASCDGLHFQGVQASETGRMRCLPDWLQSFEEGLFSGEPPDSHNVVVEQPEVKPKEKTLDDVT